MPESRHESWPFTHLRYNLQFVDSAVCRFYCLACILRILVDAAANPVYNFSSSQNETSGMNKELVILTGPMYSVICIIL